MKECQLCKNCFTDDVNTCPNDGMPTFHSISGEPILEGKYHLECRLGQGGMGVVYKARHQYLKTLHAIKVILPDLVGNDPELVTRFRQEALAAAAIRHQNVVGVSDYGVAQGTMPFLVMEFVEGESLHDLLEREGKLKPEKAIELMTAIANGIGVAHKQGIVHRDLKPLNIMLLKDAVKMSDAVKVLDFGLAKIKSGELLGSFIQAQTTGLMGSPFYMAPEQWADEEPDPPSDVYSLGIMLYQMLSGDVPFKGSSIPAIMKKHISDFPPTFASLGLNISPEIEKAVRHALEKDRKTRTQTVEQFIEELSVGLGSQTTSDAFQVRGTSNLTAVTGRLQVLTIPSLSVVFIDDQAAGKSGDDGWIIFEKIKVGNHHIRVRHEGFFDWETEFSIDDNPKELVAHLKNDTLAIPRPVNATIPRVDDQMGNATRVGVDSIQGTQNAYQNTGAQNLGHNTAQQNWQSGQPSLYNDSIAPAKSKFSLIVFAIIGIFTLFVLGIVGTGGAYFAGLFGRGEPTPTKTAEVKTPSAIEEIKPDLVEIPGGTFMMGNNRGRENERPEHEVKVETFFMDRTEVTNAEYYKFVTETGHIAPAHFVDGKPTPGQEKFPVSFVSFKDAEAFAQWRSKRDEVKYRIPTEQEWEYAARNGSKQNLYPWGDEWVNDMAVFDRPNGNSLPVGSKKGDNQWGVHDLIGNVWEWTSSPAELYPGNKGVKIDVKGNYHFVRGGGAISASVGELAVNSTFRHDAEENEVQKILGFRLVRSK
jgi:eukaryotic-like serine/threonine-protein kinase